MIHTPHSSTPIQTFHQPRTPQTLFLGVGKPHKIWENHFPIKLPSFFYQLLNHLSVHDDVEATLKLVRSEGKGALDRWKFFRHSWRWPLEDELDYQNAKVPHSFGRNIHTYHMCIYGHICMLYIYTHLQAYIYIYIKVQLIKRGFSLEVV